MHYLKVFNRFLISNFAREAEFRFNFFFWICVEVFWVTVQMFLVTFFFQYTDSIAGWTKMEVFLLIGMYRIIEGLFHIFVHNNLLSLPENITHGDFDFVLTKPLHSLFIASFRYHALDEIGTVFAGIGVVIYSLSNNSVNFFYLLLLILLGLISFYTFILFFCTLSFYFTRITALGSVYDVTAKSLRVPGQAITRGNPLVTAFLLPFLTIVTIPSQLILGRLATQTIITEISVVIISFIVAYSFWQYSIRHYSSASS